MRNIEDYTDAELLDLTEKEYNDLIDYQCALDGVPLLPPHPGPKPKQPNVKDTIYYTVGEFKFSSKSEADNVVRLLSKSSLLQERGWRSDGDRRIIPWDDIDVAVRTCRLPNEQQYNESKLEIEKFMKVKRTWDTADNTYEKAVRERKNTIEYVDGKIEAARQNIGKKRALKAKFARYIELAGDDKVAMKFLIDAEGELTPEEIQFICPGFYDPKDILDETVDHQPV